MPTSLARKTCPDLILLRTDFENYEQFSRWMFSYVQDVTPEVEVTGIDEGYFDLTGVNRPPLEVVSRLKETIEKNLKIGISFGIGSSKLVSQIASKLNKPRGLFEV